MHGHYSSCIYYFNNFFSLLCLTLISSQLSLSHFITAFSFSHLNFAKPISFSFFFKISSFKDKDDDSLMEISHANNPFGEFGQRVSWECQSASPIQQSIWKRRRWRRIDQTWRAKLVTTWTSLAPPLVPWGFCVGPRSRTLAPLRIKTMRVIDDGV